MAAVVTKYGRYYSVTGTISEVLGALYARGIDKDHIVVMKEDGTLAIYYF
jgi:hypothetical protein